MKKILLSLLLAVCTNVFSKYNCEVLYIQDLNVDLWLEYNDLKNNTHANRLDWPLLYKKFSNAVYLFIKKNNLDVASIQIIGHHNEMFYLYINECCIIDTKQIIEELNRLYKEEQDKKGEIIIPSYGSL
jgi:hypothetical protein